MKFHKDGDVYYIPYTKIDPNVKDSYLVCYYTKNISQQSISKTIDIILNDDKNIKTSLQIINRGNIYEIINIPKSYKHISVLLKSMQKIITNVPIGIGFHPSNLDEIKYFIENDYFNPRISAISMNGEYMKSYLLFLEFVPNMILPTHERVLNNVNDLLTQYKNSGITSVEHYFIDQTYLNTIYNNYVQNASNEWGGVFKKTKTNDNSLYLAEVIEGTTGNIIVPSGYINFHTHPRKIYNIYNSYIGWPSGADMKIIYDNYYKKITNIHMVFGVEGIYQIQIAPIIKNDKYNAAYSEKIFNDINNTLDRRQLSFIEQIVISPSNKNREVLMERMNINKDTVISTPRAKELNKKSLQLIQEFLYFINNYQINGKNIFIVEFTKWSDIYDRYVCSYKI